MVSPTEFDPLVGERHSSKPNDYLPWIIVVLCAFGFVSLLFAGLVGLSGSTVPDAAVGGGAVVLLLVLNIGYFFFESTQKRRTSWSRFCLLALLGTLLMGAFFVGFAEVAVEEETEVQVDDEVAEAEAEAGALAGVVVEDAVPGGNVAQKPPHIVFVLVDDIGFNDVGYQSTDLSTPNIDRIAEEGIKIESYYTMHICTPTRAVIMTGRYVHRQGLQHCSIERPEAYGLPLDEVTLAEKMRDVGYRTYMIGKWHLGYYNWASTPTERGFDHFYGFYSKETDYYTHEGGDILDLRRDKEIDFDQTGNYATFLFEDEAEKRILLHKQDFPDTPMFMYYAMQSVHQPVAAPPGDYMDSCQDITGDIRSMYCAMVLVADEAIGNLTAMLDQTFPDEEVILIVSGDNGGNPQFGANNWPLRGSKGTLYEGGVRNFAFVRSNTPDQIIPAAAVGTTYSNGIVHALDWHASIVGLGGGNYEDMGLPSDAVDVWDAVVNDLPSPREEFLYNLGPKAQGLNDLDDPDFTFFGAYRYKNWKLMYKVYNDTWHTVPEQAEIETPLNALDCWEPCDCEEMLLGQSNIFLFDLEKDPNETTDVAALNPDTVGLIIKKMTALYADSVPACNYEKTCDIDVACVELALEVGAWGPWLDL